MMTTKLTRDQAWDLLTKYTKSDALLTHALTVEAVMRHFAKLDNEDVEKWGVVGLLHDLDYEQYPEKHCHMAAEILRAEGIDEEYVHAVLSHGYGTCTEIIPQNKMEKTLYAIDELTGLITATCLMRPSKSVLDITVKSVKKKFKQKNFAAGVDREIILRGCEMLELALDDVIRETIVGMQSKAEEIGLKGNISDI
jgi:putative nucleotidyltransferase with HDIG domain